MYILPLILRVHLLPVIIMVQFAEDDRENEPLENKQLRCATSSSKRPVQFASHLSKAQPLSEVGFIFKHKTF